MRSSIRLGRLFGIDVGLHYSWFVIALLITMSLTAQFHQNHADWSQGTVWATSLLTALLFFAALLAHEMSHVLLEHAPGPALGIGGCRVWDAEVEAEADTLAGMLLVTRDAALACARVGLPHAVGAARFGVSAQLMAWRTNQTGAAKQAEAEARRRRRRLPSLGPTEIDRLPAQRDLMWLSGISAPMWREVLRRSGDAIAATAVDELASILAPRSIR